MKRSSLAVLAVLTLTLLFTTPVHAQAGGPVYRIQAGDTLSGIAFAFNTTVDAIISLNAIEDASRINIGDALVIPGFEDVEGELGLATVEIGEDLWSLSRRYGMAVDELARLNQVVNAERIYAGQRLIILSDRQPVGWTALDTAGGGGYLEVALRSGENPWTLREIFGTGPQLWMTHGPLLTEGGEDSVPLLPQALDAFGLNTNTLVQGEVVVIEAGVSPGAALSGELSGHPLHFFPLDDQLVALQGISALEATGVADLVLDVVDPESSEVLSRLVQPIRLYEGDFGFEYVNGVPAETIDPAITAPEDVLIDGLTSAATPERMWAGTFDFPSQYYTDSFVAVYGTRRSYNYDAYIGYHTGLDLYGNGVPIYAPADGVVAFAGPLIVRGNTTFIDHGWGVFTGYYHQAEILVEEGQTVERGDVIGIVGGTGRATGPHLHWEFRVGGVPVNPLDWVENVYP